MDEWFKWAMALVGSLFGALYLKNERELARIVKNLHDARDLSVSLGLFNAHVREDERMHDEARESRREILSAIERLDAKIDELRRRP